MNKEDEKAILELQEKVLDGSQTLAKARIVGKDLFYTFSKLMDCLMDQIMPFLKPCRFFFVLLKSCSLLLDADHRSRKITGEQ